MALGYLLILCVAMGAISIVGISSLLLVKNEKAKRNIFYALAVWGMCIAYVGATALPQNYTAQRLAAWGLGFLSVAGILIHVQAKDRNMRLIAYGMVVVSVVAGFIKIFF